ncbi:MAG: S8 family serine peptidase [Rhodopseudomonas sp.]|uniref:S8 family serine peptidase n=1 Tax=Rhodopseudomonas sp. TaxID=1078 RepID=UPI00183C0896|nr:S8 family serine peptidase [Rhodopseudomonas sp.]NVN88166.1 S8 family serine peptidase [Rhodopseudomonas sp.]
MAGVAGTAFQQDILFAFGGGSPAITIAVLDGPVDRTHDCFRGAWLTPLGSAAEPRSADGPATAQGTHIASLIFGQPCSSAEGVAPLCRGLIIPIFTEGQLGCSEPELASAIMLALDLGAHVINISDGLWRRGQQPDPDLGDAIARCNERNVLIITAAGGGRKLRSASGTPKAVLSVEAIDRNGRPLAGAGSQGMFSDGIAAPGSNLRGAVLEGGVAFRSGANFATALVSGIAGVLLGRQVQHGQTPNPRAVGEAILATATPRVPAQPHDCQKALLGRGNIRAAAETMTVRGVHNRGDAARSPFDFWLAPKLGSRSSVSRHAAFRPRA